MFLTGFPKQSVDVDELLAEGDLVIARHTHHATHGGPFIGLAPTGEKALVTGIAQFRFGLLQQLGAVPGAEAV